MRFPGLKVGDKLWAVGGYIGGELTVTKVGRKWGHWENGWVKNRFDLETGDVCGGGYSSPGAVYETEAHAKAHARRVGRWADFRRAVMDKHIAPEGIPAADIRRAADILGIELP